MTHDLKIQSVSLMRDAILEQFHEKKTIAFASGICKDFCETHKNESKKFNEALPIA